eukprot:3114108-Rhodomonas_salina.2
MALPRSSTRTACPRKVRAAGRQPAPTQTACARGWGRCATNIACLHPRTQPTSPGSLLDRSNALSSALPGPLSKTASTRLQSVISTFEGGRGGENEAQSSNIDRKQHQQKLLTQRRAAGSSPSTTVGMLSRGSGCGIRWQCQCDVPERKASNGVARRFGASRQLKLTCKSQTHPKTLSSKSMWKFSPSSHRTSSAFSFEDTTSLHLVLPSNHRRLAPAFRAGARSMVFVNSIGRLVVECPVKCLLLPPTA